MKKLLPSIASCLLAAACAVPFDITSDQTDSTDEQTAQTASVTRIPDVMDEEAQPGAGEKPVDPQPGDSSADAPDKLYQGEMAGVSGELRFGELTLVNARLLVDGPTSISCRKLTVDEVSTISAAPNGKSTPTLTVSASQSIDISGVISLSGAWSGRAAVQLSAKTITLQRSSSVDLSGNHADSLAAKNGGPGGDLRLTSSEKTELRGRINLSGGSSLCGTSRPCAGGNGGMLIVEGPVRDAAFERDFLRLEGGEGGQRGKMGAVSGLDLPFISSLSMGSADTIIQLSFTLEGPSGFYQLEPEVRLIEEPRFHPLTLALSGQLYTPGKHQVKWDVLSDYPLGLSSRVEFRLSAYEAQTSFSYGAVFGPFDLLLGNEP